jgi:hypothetical protein
MINNLSFTSSSHFLRGDSGLSAAGDVNVAGRAKEPPAFSHQQQGDRVCDLNSLDDGRILLLDIALGANPAENFCSIMCLCGGRSLCVIALLALSLSFSYY